MNLVCRPQTCHLNPSGTVRDHQSSPILTSSARTGPCRIHTAIHPAKKYFTHHTNRRPISDCQQRHRQHHSQQQACRFEGSILSEIIIIMGIQVGILYLSKIPYGRAMTQLLLTTRKSLSLWAILEGLKCFMIIHNSIHAYRRYLRHCCSNVKRSFVEDPFLVSIFIKGNIFSILCYILYTIYKCFGPSLPGGHQCIRISGTGDCFPGEAGHQK
jgi:hypothetical protein